MKHKFIMMEIEAGLFSVAPVGSVSRLPNFRQERTPHSPPYPDALYLSHPCMVFYNVPDSNGLAGE
jgi:hypothetical protein